MGLDVTIRTERHKAVSERENELWEGWKEGDPTPSLEYPKDDLNDGPSKLHPGNICTPTYLRSSYNEGGFNSAVPRFLKDPSASFYGIFEEVLKDFDERNNYYVEVRDPEAVRDAQRRARDVAKRLRALENPLTAIEAPVYTPGGMSDVEAIRWVEDELAKAKARPSVFADSAFSNSQGFIDPRGVMVYGVTRHTRGGALLIIKAETDGKPWTTSYIESAEILAEEFCETLLALIARDGVCYLGWSG